MPRAIIVGGSLGGLTAALLLRDSGWAVTVFERSATPLVGLGAGIVLHPTTARYLRERSSIDLAAISVASRALRYLGADGAVTHEVACRYRFSSYNALYHGLRSLLPDEHYRLGEAVTGFAQAGPGVTVELADGRCEPADLLVGADGIRSTLRRQLLPDVAPAYAGYVAWRGTVPLAELGPAEAALSDAICYHLMPRSHLLTYPIPVVDPADGSTSAHLNWLWYRNAEPGPALDDLLTDGAGARREVSVPAGAVRPELVAALHRDAEGLPPALGQLVRATGRPFIQAIVDLEVPRVTFGRVALIGDAAFVARPHAAAGTAKAADDAWALAEAVGAGADLPAALSRWEQGRLALGRAVLERTRAAGRRLQIEGSWRAGEPLPFGLYQDGDSADWG